MQILNIIGEKIAMINYNKGTPLTSLFLYNAEIGAMTIALITTAAIITIASLLVIVLVNQIRIKKLLKKLAEE